MARQAISIQGPLDNFPQKLHMHEPKIYSKAWEFVISTRCTWFVFHLVKCVETPRETIFRSGNAFISKDAESRTDVTAGGGGGGGVEGASHYAKDSGFGITSGGWSTYFGCNIPTVISHSIFDKPVLCPN